jgi:hypothetical protein
VTRADWLELLPTALLLVVGVAIGLGSFALVLLVVLSAHLAAHRIVRRRSRARRDM